MNSSKEISYKSFLISTDLKLNGKIVNTNIYSTDIFISRNIIYKIRENSRNSLATPREELIWKKEWLRVENV